MSEDQKGLSIKAKGICQLCGEFERRFSAASFYEANMARFYAKLLGE